MIKIRHHKSVLPNTLLIITAMILLFTACKAPKTSQQNLMQKYYGGFDEYGAIVFSYKEGVAPEKIGRDIETVQRFFQTSIDTYNSQNNQNLRLGFIVDTLPVRLSGSNIKIYYRVRAIFQPVKQLPVRPLPGGAPRNLQDSTGTTPSRPCGPRPGSFNSLDGADFVEVYSAPCND